MKITSIPEKDANGHYIHPRFKTNTETGLVEAKLIGADGEEKMYVVVGKKGEDGATPDSFEVRLLDEVYDKETGNIRPQKDGAAPMGPDVDLYFTWQKNEQGNYVHLDNETVAEKGIRQPIAELMTVGDQPYMTHGPYTSWAAAQQNVAYTRGPGLVALEGRLIWLNENEVEMLFDLHGASYPHGQDLPPGVAPVDNGASPLSQAPSNDEAALNASDQESGAFTVNADSPDADPNEASSHTTDSTRGHVYIGGTETNPQSPYQGKWEGHP